MDKYELNLEEIKEGLELNLFEMKLGKTVDFTATDGINMSLLCAKVREQEKIITNLQAHNDTYIDILADVRDTLLDLVDSKDNECGDMLNCTVSSPECLKCLAKQIKKQYLEKENENDR